MMNNYASITQYAILVTSAAIMLYIGIRTLQAVFDMRKIADSFGKPLCEMFSWELACLIGPTLLFEFGFIVQIINAILLQKMLQGKLSQ